MRLIIPNQIELSRYFMDGEQFLRELKAGHLDRIEKRIVRMYIEKDFEQRPELTVCEGIFRNSRVGFLYPQKNCDWLLSIRPKKDNIRLHEKDKDSLCFEKDERPFYELVDTYRTDKDLEIYHDRCELLKTVGLMRRAS